MSDATFYRCWKCGGALPSSPLERHDCPIEQIPTTGMLDRVAAVERRCRSLEAQLEFVTRELQKGFVGVRRFADGSPRVKDLLGG